MSALVDLLARRPVIRMAQLVVGVLMAWAALAKLGDIQSLARDIHNFRMLPVAGENLLAIVIPWIELTTALALFLGIRARAGALVATALLVVFTAAVALAIARGLSVECGCFGTGSAFSTGGSKLIANLGILALAAVGTLRARERMDQAPHAASIPGAAHSQAATPGNDA